METHRRSLVEVEIADQSTWMLKAYLAQHGRVFPPFSGGTIAGQLDAYLLGYQSRTWS